MYLRITLSSHRYLAQVTLHFLDTASKCGSIHWTMMDHDHGQSAEAWTGMLLNSRGGVQTVHVPEAAAPMNESSGTEQSIVKAPPERPAEPTSPSINRPRRLISQEESTLLFKSLDLNLHHHRWRAVLRLN